MYESVMIDICELVTEPVVELAPPVDVSPPPPPPPADDDMLILDMLILSSNDVLILLNTMDFVVITQKNSKSFEDFNK